MKTLDEVIDLFDKGCIRPCVECPCYGMKECQEQLAAESYYLHKYQEIEDEYEELNDWWVEEHAENVPLTWDELRTMEGKPVWVVVDGKERWHIIREVTSEHLILESELPLHKCWMNHLDGWQAYRKEKK